MSAGLFEISCPSCGVQLKVDHRGGTCERCGRSYLSRVGFLIPVGEVNEATGATVASGGT